MKKLSERTGLFLLYIVVCVLAVFATICYMSISRLFCDYLLIMIASAQIYIIVMAMILNLIFQWYER